MESSELIEPTRRWTAAQSDEASADGNESDEDGIVTSQDMDEHVPDDEEDHEHEGIEPLVSGVRSGSVITDQSAEVVPQTRVLDALNLASGDFRRLARGGVTTVYASPDASAVIGARGAVV